MTKSSFDEQRIQRPRTAIWLAAEVVLLIAVGQALAAGAFAWVLWLVALPAALVVRATISRRREQLADNQRRAVHPRSERDAGGVGDLSGLGVAPQNVELATTTL